MNFILSKFSTTGIVVLSGLLGVGFLVILNAGLNHKNTEYTSLVATGQESTSTNEWAILNDTEKVKTDGGEVLKDFYLSASANMRTCPSLTCEKLGTYAQNAKFSLAYKSLTEMPEWIEITYPKEDGTPATGYINKISISESVSKSYVKQSVNTSVNISAPSSSILCNSKFWTPCAVGQFVCPAKGDAYCQNNEPQPSAQNITDTNSQITADKQNKVLLAVTEWLISEQEYKKKQQQFNELKAAYDQCNAKYNDQITPARTRYLELSTNYNSKIKEITSSSLPPGAIQNQLNEFLTSEGNKMQDEMAQLSATLTGLTENRNSECNVYYTLITGQPVPESKPYSSSINSCLGNTSAPKAQDLNCRIIQHYDNVTGTQYEVKCDSLQCVTRNGTSGSYSASCN